MRERRPDLTMAERLAGYPSPQGRGEPSVASCAGALPHDSPQGMGEGEGEASGEETVDGLGRRGGEPTRRKEKEGGHVMGAPASELDGGAQLAGEARG